MSQKPLLSLRALSVSYGPIHALKNVSFDVPYGKIVCLIGANGAGKTTTLRAVSNLLAWQSGDILFKEASLKNLPAHQIAGLGLVHCPEGRGIFSDLSVAENLSLGAWNRPDDAELRADQDRVHALFPRLLERLSQPAGTLSGGEQQMLAIGRALMARPQLLLLDEPSLGLAPQMVELIFETIVQINREGVSVLLVEQNANQALAISDHAYVLENGSVTLEGPASQIAADDRVRTAYLGH